MSWSMLEPEDPPVCECKYDEARDVMDREDCPFHCDLDDQTQPVEKEHRKPASIIKRRPDERVA